MRHIYNYLYLKIIKNNEKCSSIMTKNGNQLGYATKTIDFHTESHHNHITMPPIQRIIATRIKHECTWSGKLGANFQKVDKHTGGKWLIQGTQHHKDK